MARPKVLFEMAIEATPDKLRLFSELLPRFGVRKETIAETDGVNKRYLSLYFTAGSKAQRLLGRLKKLGLKGVSFKIRSLQDDDWRDKWKEGFKPFKLAKSFMVIPAWRRKTAVKGKREIYIDTALAFGTGMHETTKFVAEIITELKGRFESFLDIGTGTGILAVVAQKCGAKKITAIDLAEDAVKCARNNFRINKVSGARLLKKDIGDFAGTQKFDLVAANLNTRDLVDFKNKILSFLRPGSLLAVSGIALDNSAYFRRQFKDKRIECFRIKEGKEWAAFLFKRKGKKT